MANAAVAAKGFIGKLCDVGSAHHYRDSGGAKSVGCSVSSSDHAGHGADSYQVDLLVLYELNELGIAHRFGVAIKEQNLVTGRSAGLKQEHSKVRHEVAG